MSSISQSRGRGQSLVEYAILVPIFLVILAVITDLGRITYCYSTIYNSAREGARYGIIQPTDAAGIEAKARNIAFGLDQTALTVVSVQPDDDHIQVTVTYTFTAITPVVASLLGANPITLDSQAVMLIE
jgi:Flp pilus assembly protein TadG